MRKKNKVPIALHGLYAITDGALMSGDQLLNNVRQAIEGGARLIQYRDKSHHTSHHQCEANALLELCRKHHVPLIINDDVALAKEIHADGAHIGQSDMSLENARSILGNNFIIGVTCHNDLSLALTAQQGGADYVAFGCFFPSATKPNAVQADVSLLALAKQQLTIPIAAIGGITLENAKPIVEAEADMLAVVHSLFNSTDVRQAAMNFAKLFDRPRLQ